MYHAIESAKKSVYWEVYILVDEGTGLDFFELLKRKVVEGLDVKLVIDYWGSFWLSKKKIEELRDVGIDVRLFQQKKNPVRGIRDWLMKRTHRKILIIDENIGFIGGVNVSKETKDWNDIHMMVRGKVVRSLLRSFAKSYIMCGGDKCNVKRFLKYTYRVTHDQIDFVYDTSTEKYSHARKKYTEALLKARERVILFSPYYFPDKQLLKAMWQARKRGVKIDLLIPLRTDLRIAQYAAYAWFSLLHLKGVNIHLSKKMMHGKGVVVDDDWAMIGSSNLDHTSFYYSEEANVRLRDKKMVKKLKRVLERWMKDSTSFDNVAWEKRGAWERTKEKIATKLYKMWFKIK